MSALRVILPYFYNRLMWRMGDSIVAELRTEIFAKLQKLPFEYFDNRPAGKISVRVTDYIDELGDFFAWNLMYFIVDILNILVVTVFMLFLSPVLALVVYGGGYSHDGVHFFAERRGEKIFPRAESKGFQPHGVYRRIHQRGKW